MAMTIKIMGLFAIAVISISLFSCFAMDSSCHGKYLATVQSSKYYDSIWMSIYEGDSLVFSDSGASGGPGSSSIDNFNDSTRGPGSYVLKLTLQCNNKRVEVAPLSYTCYESAYTYIIITDGWEATGTRIPMSVPEGACPGITQLVAHVDHDDGTCQ
jgi:hypothetical protein